MTDEKVPVMEAGGGSKRLMYTPHLKKVLKSYQASATKSLHGPNSVMGVWQGSESDDAASVSPPNPTLTVTDLPKEKTLFAVATETTTGTTKKVKPSTSQQSVSTVVSSVKDTHDYDPFIAPPPFPIQQPPIFTPADQTRCEKSETILESETIACFNVGGEDRLCLPQILTTVLRDFCLPQINCVCDNLHIYCSRCNQDQLEVLKATGILPFNAPSCGLITKTDAQRLCAALLDSNPLIVQTKTDMKPPFQVKVYHECFGECRGLYTPDLYQHPHAPCIECLECHALLNPQKFVCHVHHAETRTCHWGFDAQKWPAYILLDVELENEIQLQEALHEMKDRFGSTYKRKQILEESCDPSQKRVRVDNCLPYPFGMDPMLVYYYSHSHLWENAFQAYPSVITKDGKTLYIPPDTFPQLIQKSMHNLRNRVTFTPANVQKFMSMKVQEEQTVFAYHAHKAETLTKRPHLKKEPDHDSISYFDSEDAYSDTSFSTLSAGTEDGLVSNFDDEDELQPSTESEFLELKKVLTEVDVPLRTKILSEVETIVAKYRKCLNVAVQGKKLYQMELEKIHYTQRAKLHKVREKCKNLERELQKYRNSVSAVSVTEQFESQNANVTPNPPSPHSPVETKDTPTDNNPESEIVIIPLEEGVGKDLSESEETFPVCSPTLPKQTLLPDAEPLGK